MSGYFQNWTVEAARDAIAADAHIPIALLDDPDPDVREASAYVPAASTGRAGEISAALHDRLRAEDDARVGASLVLAIAQLAREHRHEDAAAFTRALWSDPARPAEVRVSAALGWLCLVDDPAPDTLRRPRRVRHRRTRPFDGLGALDDPGRLRRRRTDPHPAADVRPGFPPTPGGRRRPLGGTRGVRRRPALLTARRRGRGPGAGSGAARAPGAVGAGVVPAGADRVRPRRPRGMGRRVWRDTCDGGTPGLHGGHNGPTG
ncbi:hypothetical protein OG948_57115 (plasmid) [Embleya sp. NBC_00888]|uniref:hypothetical protein n=1 Tax=Embleya sp. NBC_00888 TaxID=2975960 RepID=UPI002F909A83|nr:hypothetical protein OG948_57115 [Embleya sp. NBC_00888]